MLTINVIAVVLTIASLNLAFSGANDSIYKDSDWHGQPPDTNKDVHHYNYSPPKPFDKKGNWHGTVHYDWGWYQGPWKNGRWHTEEGEVGHCHHWDDERTYVGEFKNHKIHGKGVMTYPDGHKVSGAWENVYSWKIFMGHGKVEWTDGRVWHGPWKDGQPHGKGKLTYPDGDTVEGHFEHGHCAACEEEHRHHYYEHKKRTKYEHIHYHLHHTHAASHHSGAHPGYSRSDL